VPADDGLRADEHEVAPPVATETAGEDPEQLVARADPGAFAGAAGEDGELVAQERVLDEEVPAAAQGGSGDSDQDSENLEHAHTIADSGPDPLDTRYCRPSGSG
jgi:hypothetical protein